MVEEVDSNCEAARRFFFDIPEMIIKVDSFESKPTN